MIIGASILWPSCRNLWRTTFGVGFLPPLWPLGIKLGSSGLSSKDNSWWPWWLGSTVEEDGSGSLYLFQGHTPQWPQFLLYRSGLKVLLPPGSATLGSKTLLTHGHWRIFPVLLACSAHGRWGYTILHFYLEKLLQAGQDPYNKIWISSQLLFYYKRGVRDSERGHNSSSMHR